MKSSQGDNLNSGQRKDNSADNEHSRSIALDAPEGLFPIPEKAAQAYLNKLDKLIEDVDEDMTSRADLSQLIGHSPVEVMLGNHSNHARFMSVVFSLNLPATLKRILPWVYHAYSSRGFSYNYFPAALENWSNAIKRHLPPGDAGPILEVYRWIMNSHEAIVEQSRHSSLSATSDMELSNKCEALLTSVLKGDTHEAQRLLVEEAASPADMTDIYIDLVQPVMYRIGALWEQGKVSVAQEHLATSIMARAMVYTYQRFDVFGDTRGKAMITAVSDEMHELGARIVADLLEINGWNVAFLGANVPVADLTQLALDTRPNIIGLSITMPYHLISAGDIIKEIRQHSACKDTRIMVGGQSFAMAPEAAERIGADGLALGGREAVALAEDWWKAISE